MSDALRLYRLRTKAMKEALDIDVDVESDCEVDNGLSAFDEWENQIITLLVQSALIIEAKLQKIIHNKIT